jgi:hypothetical protein
VSTVVADSAIGYELLSDEVPQAGVEALTNGRVRIARDLDKKHQLRCNVNILTAEYCLNTV